MSIDEKIKQAEIIIVGEVKSTLPGHCAHARRKGFNKGIARGCFESRLLSRNSVISINQLLKGDYEKPDLRVRAFVGEIEQVRWVNPTQPSYIPGHKYLLFLKNHTGPTAKIEPGHFMSINSAYGVYEIVDGKAISMDDEWVFEDLIAYIQNALQSSQ